MNPILWLLVLAALAPLTAVEWSWPCPGADAVEVCTFRYGKTWAYAIEFDDNPTWARSFAVPLLAEHQWTDAPPGVVGGARRPFVAGIGVIVGGVGGGDQSLSWSDLDALEAVGWGAINHSLSHTGRSWGEGGQLDDRQVCEDAYWSQALMAANLASRRAPTACIYANGYTDYNRGGALELVGVRIATRVGGSSPTDVTRDDVRWMDFPRNYLDEEPWKADGLGEPMAGIPAADGAGPAANQFIVDFTHGIDLKPESENQRRWRTRLSTIASRWGAGGSDALWCAPTGEIADYVHAAKAATARVAGGKVHVAIPDQLPGTALTLRLSGVPASAKIATPPGGTLHRAGDVVWLTTPPLGQAGAPAPVPRVVELARGEPGVIDLKGAKRVAGVSVRLGGHADAGFSYRVALRTATGEVVIAEAKPDLSGSGGWANGTQLHAIVPTGEPILATAVVVPRTAELMREVIVWGVADR